ncbi:Sprouty-related protein with EVH-1 domain [Carabus blaptoides fortunei]
MTEGFEDGNYLVRVRAQVMSRDDSSGGWVPLGGGGLSNVSVRKRPRVAPSTGTSQELSQPKHDYLIYGKRISDQSIVLSCLIKKDFEYNKVMPTFHHWKTGDKKFGLTFQTAADARAFDKGVRTAVEELLDGLTETYPLSPLHKYHKDVGDDDVFMTLNLPVEAGDSRSSSDSSTTTRAGSGLGLQSCGVPPPSTEHLHRIHYHNRTDKPPPPGSLCSIDPAKDTGKGENYSYVQLTAVHEYIDPVMDDGQKVSVGRRDSISSLKKRSLEVIPTQPSLPLKAKQKNHKYIRTQCRHCHELYSEEDNPKGSCEYAPDCVKSGINSIACISCAQCMLYHCMADAEGDFAAHPCECGNSDENCGKRWLGLALLSLFVPCLWCYPPLKLCHWCGVTCGLCGGRHSMY